MIQIQSLLIAFLAFLHQNLYQINHNDFDDSDGVFQTKSRVLNQENIQKPLWKLLAEN